MAGSYHSPFDGKPLISATEFKTLPHDDQVEVMKHWFHEFYWDPANDTPYNSQEGGYLYLRGGPYDANDELYEEFGSLASEETIQKAALEIQSDGLDEWAPRPNHPDYVAYVEDAEEAYWEPVPPPSLEEIQERLIGGVRPQFGGVHEQETRSRLQGHIAEMRALLAAQTPRFGTMGHNRPPEAMALPDELIAELTQVMEIEAAELQEDAPELAEVAKAAGVFQRLVSWGAEKANLTIDAFLKAIGTAGGVALAGQIALGGWQRIWVKLGKVYEATLEWLNLVTLPF